MINIFIYKQIIIPVTYMPGTQLSFIVYSDQQIAKVMVKIRSCQGK